MITGWLYYTQQQEQRRQQLKRPCCGKSHVNEYLTYRAGCQFDTTFIFYQLSVEWCCDYMITECYLLVCLFVCLILLGPDHTKTHLYRCSCFKKALVKQRGAPVERGCVRNRPSNIINGKSNVSPVPWAEKLRMSWVAHAGHANNDFAGDF